MEQNFSKIASRLGFYLCWIFILTIGGIYIYSTLNPWPKTLFNLVAIPNVDPPVHIDTHYYALPQKMYNYDKRDVPPNKSLVEKSRKFYSSISTDAYFNVFYRPDFERYPTITGLILFFRIATLICIITFFYLLASISKIVYSGDPFVHRNQQRVFFMGFLLLLIPVLRTLHSTVLAAFLRLDPKLLGYGVYPSYKILWVVLFGVLLISGSFVYKELIRLHEEQQLTI